MPFEPHKDNILTQKITHFRQEKSIKIQCHHFKNILSKANLISKSVKPSFKKFISWMHL